MESKTPLKKPSNDQKNQPTNPQQQQFRTGYHQYLLVKLEHIEHLKF